MTGTSNRYVLGLDLGPTSIGWAALNEAESGEITGVIGTGVRIFQKTVDNKTGVPHNAARRAKRLMRRRRLRFVRRRAALVKRLVSAGLLPTDAQERDALLKNHEEFDPYRLRAEALDRALRPFEFGRIIFHLNQRRGFLSNRKSASNDDSGEVKPKIKQLQEDLEKAGMRTLGEFLYSVKLRRNRNIDIAPRYTAREMYRREFELICQVQQKMGLAGLTPELALALKRIIFFQRPLKSQRGKVGRCSLEPTKKRALKASLLAQEFRFYQDLNNLRVQRVESGEERALSEGERDILVRLARQESKVITWAKLRKSLGLHKSDRFNLERSKDKGLKVLSTRNEILSALGLGEAARFDDTAVSQISIDLLTIDSEKGLLNRLKGFWGFTEEQVSALCDIRLEPGFASLSAKAMRSLLPLMRAGLRFDEAKSELYRHDEDPNRVSRSRLGPPRRVTNPLVFKALIEARRVINALISKYGMPRAIRIEMARDLKNSETRRREIEVRQRERADERRKAREAIIQSGVLKRDPTRSDIDLYLLWQEARFCCPYSGGNQISIHELFSGDIHIEHIIPYSRSLDDSFANRTIARAHINASKGERTPFEFFGGPDSKEWEAFLLRIRALPLYKQIKMKTEKVEESDFINRHLNDTSYICTEVKDYLGTLPCQVSVGRGMLTSEICHKLALYRFIHPAKDNEKCRDDHRHHAIDAVAVALSSPRLLQRASLSFSRRPDRYGGVRLKFDEPYSGFSDDVGRSVSSLTVSHATRHGTNGALHEDTCFSVRFDPYKQVERTVYRRSLASLADQYDLDDIVDPFVRELIIAHVKKFGDGDLRPKGKARKAAFAGAPRIKFPQSDTFIRSVRIWGSEFNPKRAFTRFSGDGSKQFFDSAANYCLDVCRDKVTGTPTVRIRNLAEAVESVRRIKRLEPPEGCDLVVRLHKQDTVSLSGDPRFFRVQKFGLKGNSADVTLRDVTSAELERESAQRLSSPSDLIGLRKVRVSVLGEVLDDQANDRDSQSGDASRGAPPTNS